MAPRDAGVEPAGAPAPQGPRVRLIHALPGRTRLAVSGLRRTPAMRDRLQRGLRESAGVNAAWASTDTGTVLVLHDTALGRSALVARTEAVAAGEVADPSAATDWHARPREAVLAEMGSRAGGLASSEARLRLRETGPNLLPRPPSRDNLAILVDQFRTLPTMLLAGAAVLSVFTGGLAEAAAIVAVLGLNGAIGFTVESRAEHTIQGLEGPAGSAQVVRDGRQVTVLATELVPGDLLALSRDHAVFADARILRAQELSVNEAMLTGESLPVTKSAEAVAPAAPLGDRDSMVWRGTAVTGGSGSAVVVATGRRTEIGRIHALLGEATSPPTSMQVELDRIGRQLVWASLAACGAVFGIGALRGLGLLGLLRSSISLGIAAIPEGLPTVATTTLARGVEAARRDGVLVRRLDAVETLGAVDIACFDKTGTLTANRMEVASVVTEAKALEAGQVTYGAADPALARLIEVGVLCSQTSLDPDAGSATELALIALARRAGADPGALRRGVPRLSIRHRSEAERFMTTTHRRGETVLMAVKGSPSDVLALCATELTGAGTPSLSAARREAIERANAELAARGLRVLGFAFREAAEVGSASAGGLTWLGLAGLSDPVRPGVAELLGRLREAGIHPLVMTGDQSATARAVAAEVGLGGADGPRLLDGGAVEGKDPLALAALVRQADVAARVSPAQKLRIVRALQQAGSVVAMVGDGFNDGPALKTADVGIAMGGLGAEAAREAAGVVLPPGHLEPLAEAIGRGRATSANVRRATRYLLATNLSEILVVLAGTALGSAEPLSALQLLWINLVSDVLPGLGLACEAPAPGQMQRPPPSRNTPILDRTAWPRLAREGSGMAAGALAAGSWGAMRGGAEASTMMFGSLLLGQLLHALNCRDPGAPPNPALSGALALSFGAQGAAVLVPGLRRLLGLSPLGPIEVAVTLAGGIAPFLFNRALRTPALSPS